MKYTKVGERGTLYDFVNSIQNDNNPNGARCNLFDRSYIYFRIEIIENALRTYLTLIVTEIRGQSSKGIAIYNTRTLLRITNQTFPNDIIINIK